MVPVSADTSPSSAGGIAGDLGMMHGPHRACDSASAGSVFRTHEFTIVGGGPERRVPWYADGACPVPPVFPVGRKERKRGVWVFSSQSLRLRRTPAAARSPASAPNTGAGAWVRVGRAVTSPAAEVAEVGAVVVLTGD